MDALTASPPLELGAADAQDTKRPAVIHPGNLQSGQEQSLELDHPQRLLDRKPDRLSGAEPLGVKSDVPGLVAQDQFTNLPQDRIRRPILEQTIVRRADQFGDDKHLDFEADSQSPPENAEQRMCPMPAHQATVVPLDQLPQKARMFLFLPDEKRQRFLIGGIIGMRASRLTQQVGAFAAFTKLEVGK
ncbi:MAG: hypothetical protein P4L99_08075 [Chthoniobacter sp.]|nr:hypothetical protein [Chthoniobacter sp.]